MPQQPIRVIAFQDGEQWVAQCLEHDISAQAPDLETLNARISLAIDLELKISMEKRTAPFAGLDPAPQHFFDMWDRRAGSLHVERPAAPTWHGKDLQVELSLCA